MPLDAVVRADPSLRRQRLRENKHKIQANWSVNQGSAAFPKVPA
jgi:hypothetical protein